MTTRRADHDSLVPPERWGALLHRTRRADGRTLVGVSRLANGWTPDKLADVERGMAVDDSDLDMLARAYHLDVRGGGRQWRLVLDRSTDARTSHSPAGTVSIDAAMVRAMALAVVCGVDLANRTVIELVAEWLDVDRERVRSALDSCAGDGESISRWLDDNASRWCVPSAGFRVGLSASGSLSLVSHAGASGGRCSAGQQPVVQYLGDVRRSISGRVEREVAHE